MGPFHDNLTAQMASALEKIPRLVSDSRFIFIPAPGDFLSPKVFPIVIISPLLNENGYPKRIHKQRSDPPSRFLRPLQRIGLDVALASNPCRIFFFTKEIVLFRDEISLAIKSECVIRRDSQTTHTAMQSMLSQGTLLPVDLGSRARHWGFEHCLDLYPAPDYLIVGEGKEACLTRADRDECISSTTGSFSSESSFLVLFPLLGRLDTWFVCSITILD